MNVVAPLKSAGWIYAAGLVWLLTAATAMAADLYRYRNDEGNLVINHTMPPRFAKNGYERIDSNGRVVERVEALAPKTETGESSEEGEDADVSPKAAVAQERLDKYLLVSFSTVEEISAARERKLTQLLREVEVTRGSVEKIDRQRLTAEQEAAQYQRSGKDIPEAIKNRMSDIEERGKRARESMQSRQIEHAQAEKLYAGYIKRFKKLKGLSPEPSDSEASGTGFGTGPATDPPSVQSVDD